MAAEANFPAKVAQRIDGEDFSMALNKSEHRGMNFAIEPIGEAEWRWRFHPKGEPNAASDDRFTGTAWGSNDAAVAACKSVIDQWLDHRRAN